MPEVTIELVRRQLALAVARKDRLDAQIGPQHQPPVRPLILDHIVARQIAGQLHVCLVHALSVARRPTESLQRRCCQARSGRTPTS